MADATMVTVKSSAQLEFEWEESMLIVNERLLILIYTGIFINFLFVNTVLYYKYYLLSTKDLGKFLKATD